MSNIKQVILIRRDLKMRRGKEIAQGSHAAGEFIVHQLREKLLAGGSHSPVAVELTPAEVSWITLGIAKVCLQVGSEEELLRYFESAKAAGLPAHVIRDSGRTEFHGVPTFTACAIGPAEVEKIDAITGELSLY